MTCRTTQRGQQERKKESAQRNEGGFVPRQAGCAMMQRCEAWPESARCRWPLDESNTADVMLRATRVRLADPQRNSRGIKRLFYYRIRDCVCLLYGVFNSAITRVTTPYTNVSTAAKNAHRQGNTMQAKRQRFIQLATARPACCVLRSQKRLSAGGIELFLYGPCHGQTCGLIACHVVRSGADGWGKGGGGLMRWHCRWMARRRRCRA